MDDQPQESLNGAVLGFMVANVVSSPLGYPFTVALLDNAGLLSESKATVMSVLFWYGLLSLTIGPALPWLSLLVANTLDDYVASTDGVRSRKFGQWSISTRATAAGGWPVTLCCVGLLICRLAIAVMVVLAFGRPGSRR